MLPYSAAFAEGFGGIRVLHRLAGPDLRFQNIDHVLPVQKIQTAAAVVFCQLSIFSLGIQNQHPLSCLTEIGQQELHQVGFSLTGVAQDQDVAVGFVVGPAIQVYQNIGAVLIPTDVEALGVCLTGEVERKHISNGAGWKHPLKLTSETVTAKGHGGEKPLFLPQSQAIYGDLGTGQLHADIGLQALQSAHASGLQLLYTEETLRNICLGLNSICVGSESRFFNGHTNIQDNMFLVFGVKGVMDLNKKLRCAIEFNILSYMTHQLLSVGNCVAALDELYLFLDSPVTIEYIRNNMKRVRKKESAMVLASQNIEDFLLPNIREMTKPLFSIPTHQFLFNPGQINPKDYMDALQVEPSEYDLIHGCERGHNLYRCGNERYLLQVIAPEHKAALFGTAGGR